MSSEKYNELPENELEKADHALDLRKELIFIPDVPKLTLEHARELSLRLHAGMNPQTNELTADAKAAREEMVFSCKRMVIFLALANSFQGLDVMDLIQEGFIGAQRAAENYKPELGHKFSTYAFRPIYWSIKHAIWAESKHDKKGLVFSDVTTDEGEVVFDFESQIMDDNAPFRGQIEEKILFIDAIKSLPPNKRQVIVRYFFEGWTFDEIGAQMGVCRERVGQLKDAALKQLSKCSGINPSILEKAEL